MIEVTLYSRANCHLCDEARALLVGLSESLPMQIKEIDVDSSPDLVQRFGETVPVIQCGPYTISAPIDAKDLEITLRAAQQRLDQIADIEQGIASGRISVDIPWTKSDGFSLWLSRNWLMMFNLFTLVYVGLPFLAPVFMRAGLTAPANIIYRVYGAVCHQFAYRSWFAFGEQAYYPRTAVGDEHVHSYPEATGQDENDLWTARAYIGDERVGYKIALCQRDIAIYLGILAFGLIFAASGSRIPGLPWWIWLAFGVFPIGLDGLSQLVSQPPLSLIAFRESTPLLRTVTGGLFGFMTAWFGYPIAEESMRESRDYLQAKLKRIKDRSQPASEMKV